MSRVFEGGRWDEQATTGLSEDDAFRLLADERRRVTVGALADLGSPLGLNELAREVADRETRGDGPSAETVQNVKLTLHHNHLPKLADVGVLEYFPDAQWLPATHANLDDLVE